MISIQRKTWAIFQERKFPTDHHRPMTKERDVRVSDSIPFSRSDSHANRNRWSNYRNEWRALDEESLVWWSIELFSDRNVSMVEGKLTLHTDEQKNNRFWLFFTFSYEQEDHRLNFQRERSFVRFCINLKSFELHVQRTLFAVGEHRRTKPIVLHWNQLKNNPIASVDRPFDRQLSQAIELAGNYPHCQQWTKPDDLEKQNFVAIFFLSLARLTGEMISSMRFTTNTFAVGIQWITTVALFDFNRHDYPMINWIFKHVCHFYERKFFLKTFIYLFFGVLPQ